MLSFIPVFSSILITASIIGIVGILGGGTLGYVFFNIILKKRRESIIKEAELEAEVIKKDKILQAKEKFFQIKTEHEKVINERNNKVVQAENRIKQKEQLITQKLEEVQKQKKDLDTYKDALTMQTELAERKQEELEKIHRLPG